MERVCDEIIDFKPGEEWVETCKLSVIVATVH